MSLPLQEVAFFLDHEVAFGVEVKTQPDRPGTDDQRQKQVEGIQFQFQQIHHPEVLEGHGDP